MYYYQLIKTGWICFEGGFAVYIFDFCLGIFTNEIGISGSFLPYVHCFLYKYTHSSSEPSNLSSFHKSFRIPFRQKNSENHFYQCIEKIPNTGI